MYAETWGCKHGFVMNKQVLFRQHGADTPGCLI